MLVMAKEALAIQVTYLFCQLAQDRDVGRRWLETENTVHRCAMKLE